MKRRDRDVPTLIEACSLLALWGPNVKCARCRNAYASHPHHRKPKARGGSNTPGNLIPLCVSCHRWVHANPDAAHAAGFLLHSWEPESEFVVVQMT
jgi:5-methylcytosine-specific restriction endonuclease McrA